MKPRICIYVPTSVAKQNYKNESFNTRKNIGAAVVFDILKRNGYDVEYCGEAGVDCYDIVLVSLTSDCDWWEFIAERSRWAKGDYIVAVGGQGVLNVRPFLPFVDYFMLGRAENMILDFVSGNVDHPSIVCSKTFSADKDYYINQVSKPYPHNLTLEDGSDYKEDQIGCNHKCLFCSYTWSRKHCGLDEFEYGGLWGNTADVERAMIDIYNGVDVDLQRLRTTSIDGMSERLRFMVNKKITREMVVDFTYRIATIERPHQIKYYNIVGYPTETKEDWFEFLDDVKAADSRIPKRDKQMGLILHNTPFRPMPATPMACDPASYVNYRGLIAQTLGLQYANFLFFRGNGIFAVESLGTESLPTHTMSMICHRGTEDDADAVKRIACSSKFKKASMAVKQATLEKYFDVAAMFRSYDPEELPTRYLKTYANVEKMWGRKRG